MASVTDLDDVRFGTCVDEERTSSSNEEESVEQLIQRAEDQYRNFIESSSSEATTNECNSQNAINGLMVDTYVSSTLNGAQATLDSIRENPTVTIPIHGASSSSDNNLIVVDSDDDDDVVLVHSNIPEVVDLCSPSGPPILYERFQFNERSVDANANATHGVSNQPDLEADTSNRILCPICMESSVQPHSTRCGHIYCGSCIKQSFKMTKKCPLCNKVLKLSEIHPVYI